MDGDRVRGPARGPKARKRTRGPSVGLTLTARDGHWHVTGTIRAQGRAARVRRSLGLVATEGNREAAEIEARRIEAEIRGELSGTWRPGDYVAVAAKRYLSRARSRPLGYKTKANVTAIASSFGLRRLNEIRTEDWPAWVDERTTGRSAATRERLINDVLAFLNWCRRNAGLTAVPEFTRDRTARNPNRRARRRIGDLRPELIARLFAACHITVRAQLAVEWSTGARVSSVLHGCRVCDLILAPGRESITFHDTKNGTSVTAALKPTAAAILRDYLEWRGRLHDREAPLFLTYRRQPYANPEGRWGGQNKTAYRAARRRAITALRRDAAAEARRLRAARARDTAWDVIGQAKADAALLAKVTQHWFRHLLATQMRGDLRSAMEQGGWLDMRSVVGYQHDVGDYRRQIIRQLDDLAARPEIRWVKA